MVPIFQPLKKSSLSTLRVCRAPASRREARVAAVCGFLLRLRVCAQQRCKSPRCADVQRTKSQSSNAIAILRGGAAEWMSFRARAEAKDMELVPTKEPASHLASRRSTGSLPNASNRAEARTHYFVTKSAARVTPCGRGHSTLRSLAPQFQTKPASLGFCLVEGNERYGGKYAKK